MFLLLLHFLEGVIGDFPIVGQLFHKFSRRMESGLKLWERFIVDIGNKCRMESVVEEVGTVWCRSYGSIVDGHFNHI